MKQEIKHWLRIDRACNNKCLFCLDYKSQNNSFYSFNFLKNKINKIYVADYDGGQRLILSGGEPTIHPDFIELVKFGKKRGFSKIQTITNGRMFYYKNFVKQARQAGLDEITFSLHGHNKKLHDQLTGVTGSFEQSVSGLKNALSNNFIVNVDIVINKLNYRQLLDIIKYFHQLGVNEFDLLTLMPYGRAWDLNFNDLFYNLDDFKSVFAKMLDYQENNGLVIWYNRFPVSFFEDREYLIREQDTKLYHEIFGERLKHFEKYLTKGKMLECFDPKKCQYCFINGFCCQLFKFNELVKNREFKTSIFSKPFCLGTDNYKDVDLTELLTEKMLDLEKFFKFYLENLNLYKSTRCKECGMTNDCLGIPLETIKSQGFKILKPIKNETH